MRKIVTALALVSLAACSNTKTTTATLYRSSAIISQMRAHMATFDSPEGFNYNYGNCTQVARIMNANIDAFAVAEHKPRNSAVGLWCEAGKYSEKGNVPTSFVSEFPSLGETLPNEGTPFRL